MLLLLLRRRMKANDFRVAVIGDPGCTLHQIICDFDLVEDARYHPAHLPGFTVDNHPGELKQLAQVLVTGLAVGALRHVIVGDFDQCTTGLRCR